jgi:plasmid maintenance system killer protein
MIVRYSSRKLERQCTDLKALKKSFGPNADRIANRIKALEDSTNLDDLKHRDPLGRWESLTADRDGTWSAWASRNHRIIVQPSVEDSATLQIEQVTVESVNTDYHRR